MKTYIGTPVYMAPEQRVSESKFYSKKIDIYALGKIFYEIVNPDFDIYKD